MTEPAERYREAVARHDAAREEAHRASVRLSRIRGATFVAAAAAFLAWDVLEGAAATAALVVGAALVVAFFVEVGVHRRHRRRERWHETLLELGREGLHRMDRRWSELAESLPPAERAVEGPGPEHPYARDLDLVGQASLLRLLGPVTGETGRDLLLGWLLAPAPPDEVRARQEAVAELAPRFELRAEFAAHGRLDAPREPHALAPFLGWAEEEPWLPGRTGLVWAARLLPVALLALVAGDVFLGMGPWWLLPGLAQLEVLRRTSRVLSPQLAAAASGGPVLGAYVPQLRLLEEAEWSAARLRELDARLRGADPDGARDAPAAPPPAGEPASAGLDRLAGLLDTVESRRNMFWAGLAPVLLLDVHLSWRLDRWRAAHGPSVRRWLDALGEWEALSALAALAHDHPGWCFPRVGEEGGDAVVVRAEEIGHPLLRPDECVANDVTVGPPGTFLLVTGSNMSGKSTLLRALGTNVVLAQAGGPACARSLSLPALRVHTSMRIDDSLARGVSLFMAELLRVRDIVRAADADGPPVLYLLDEILHGTNTAERRVAARGIIRHLLDAGAVGAVSTHDLTLARAADLEAAAEAVHFREEVEEVRGAEGGATTRLHFDYTLRPGIATTRNALKLLEAVGLGGLELAPDEEDAGPADPDDDGDGPPSGPPSPVPAG